jgi:hypothetical protein
MEQKPYETCQHILEEAGFYHFAKDDKLTGAVDGGNKVFFTTYKPLFETRNSDDGQVTSADIVVLVNGVNVEVETIDGNTGAITLFVAPPENAEVVADYYYSNVRIDYVKNVRDEATAHIDSYLKSVDCKLDLAITRNFCRLYAAGLLLIKDYGYNTDLELTSKDGYKKIDMVDKGLADYRVNLSSSSSGTIDNPSAGVGAIEVVSDGDMAGGFGHCRRPHSEEFR